MHTDTHTGLESPPGIWWKPAHKSEKVWVGDRLCLVHGALRDDAALALEGRAESVRHPGPHHAAGVRRARRRIHHAIPDRPGPRDAHRQPAARRRHLSRRGVVSVVPDPEAAEERGVYAPPVVARREPRVLALPDQRQFPGRAGLRLWLESDPERLGRLPHHVQRVLRHRPPRDGRARHRRRRAALPQPRQELRDDDCCRARRRPHARPGGTSFERALPRDGASTLARSV